MGRCSDSSMRPLSSAGSRESTEIERISCSSTRSTHRRQGGDCPEDQPGNHSKKYQRQTWGISPKINEVDRLLLNFRGKAHRIREVHPEVCFWALADRKPMKYRKTSAEGRNERLQILQRYEIGVTSLLGNALSKTLRNKCRQTTFWMHPSHS